MNTKKFNFIKDSVSNLFKVNKISGSVYGYKYHCEFLRQKVTIEVIAFDNHCELGQVVLTDKLVNDKDFNNRINTLTKTLYSYSE